MTTRVGVVGYGRWGRVLARKISARTELTLAWVCDLNPQVLQEAFELFQTHPSPPLLTQDVSDLCRDPTLTHVCVALPPTAHFKVSEALLSARKHLWLEKPCGVARHELEALIKRSQHAQRALHLGYLHLHHPHISQFVTQARALKRDSQPLHFQAWRENDCPHGASSGKRLDVLYDLGVHDLSLLKLIAPLPHLDHIDLHLISLSHTSSQPSQTPFTDHKERLRHIRVDLNTPHTRASLTMGWGVSPKRRALWVEGTEERARFEQTSEGEVMWCERLITDHRWSRGEARWRAPRPEYDALDSSITAWLNASREAERHTTLHQRSSHHSSPDQARLWQIALFCHDIAEALESRLESRFR